jgi:hypothetical protein
MRPVSSSIGYHEPAVFGSQKSTRGKNMKKTFFDLGNKQNSPILATGKSGIYDCRMIIISAIALSVKMVVEYARANGAIYKEDGKEYIVFYGFGPTEAKLKLPDFERKYAKSLANSGGMVVSVGTTSKKIRRRFHAIVAGMEVNPDNEKNKLPAVRKRLYLKLEVRKTEFRSGETVEHRSPVSFLIRPDKVHNLVISQ